MKATIVVNQLTNIIATVSGKDEREIIEKIKDRDWDDEEIVPVDCPAHQVEWETLEFEVKKNEQNEI